MTHPEDRPESRPESRPERRRFDAGLPRADELRAWSAGLNIVSALAGGLILGALIDWAAGTRPWVMLGLGLVGLVGGFARFIREASAINKDAAARFRDDHPRGPTSPADDDANGSPPG